MADPLTYAAAQVAPGVRPATNFFEPSESLNIIDRYTLSMQARAFAEGALKSADEIDERANFNPQQRRNTLEKHEWDRTLKDREDLAYKEKKEFEAARGQFLIQIAGLNDEDEQFDTQLSEVLGADPRLADDDAVKQIINIKLQNRENRIQQGEYDRRFDKEAAARAAADGAPVDKLTDPATGKFDFAGYGKWKFEQEQSAAKGKAADAARDDARKTYGDDEPVISAGAAEDLEPVVTARKTGLTDAAKNQGIGLTGNLDDLVAKAPTLGKNAFIASVLQLSGSSGAPKDEKEAADLLSLLAQDTSQANKYRTVMGAAGELWNAANRKGLLPSKGKRPSDPAQPNPVNDDVIAETERISKEKP